jgi:hypothetical protein
MRLFLFSSNDLPLLLFVNVVVLIYVCGDGFEAV